jgi:hypothetical protein
VIHIPCLSTHPDQVENSSMSSKQRISSPVLAELLGLHIGTAVTWTKPVGFVGIVRNVVLARFP